MLDALCGLAQRINVDDYAPATAMAATAMATTPMSMLVSSSSSNSSSDDDASRPTVTLPSRPGVVLSMLHVATGVRVSACAGCAWALLLWRWRRHRTRLRRHRGSAWPRTRSGGSGGASRGDAASSWLHGAWDSLAYSTPLGAAGGLLYGVWHEARALQPRTLAARRTRERAALATARRQTQRQLYTAEQRLRASQSVLQRVLVACRLRTDVVAMRVAHMRARADAAAAPTRFGLLWMRAHSTVHSPRWYTHTDDEDNDKDVDDRTAQRDDGDVAMSSSSPPQQHCQQQHCDTAAAATACYSFSSTTPPARVYLSKLQTDHLVGRLLQVQCDAAAQCSHLVTFTCVLMGVTWSMLNTSGARTRRCVCGIGGGVVLSTALSAIGVDALF